MSLEQINLLLLGVWIAFIVVFYYTLMCKADTCSFASYIGDIAIVVYSACITYFLLENVCTMTLYKVFVVAVISHFTGRIFFILIRHYRARRSNESKD
jgi:hypothetical protein